MRSPQEHPGSGMLPWMRQLGADPPSLHLPLLPHLARMLLWPPQLQRAQSHKKKETFGGPNPGEGGCKRARSNREGGEKMEEEEEEQRERQEREDRRVREARDTEERRHREAVEREERRERETRERDEPYLALLELIAQKKFLYNNFFMETILKSITHLYFCKQQASILQNIVAMSFLAYLCIFFYSQHIIGRHN